MPRSSGRAAGIAAALALAVSTAIFVAIAPVATSRLRAQQPTAAAAEARTAAIRARYTKYEYRVPMRDGVRIFTSVYVPKDASKPWPFLLTRTPYSVGPYGVDAWPTRLGPSPSFEASGFIFVFQDARGRYMSEGEFKQVRPHVPVKRGPKDVDESSDTYDTIAWLLEHIPNHNGRVGMVGISQPGFHVAASLIGAHPALKAASPQAPTADYYLGDDVYHNGAFMLAANFGFYSGFRPRGDHPAPPRPGIPFDYGTPDGYEFFLNLGPLATVNARLLDGKGAYFQEIVDHPNYDDFWKVRSLWKHATTGITPAVLNVGGWFDAEDPVGPLHMYRAIEQDAKADNRLVMGPWSHGGWSRGSGKTLGNLDFGFETGEFFREQIQLPWFLHHLKDAPLPAAFPDAYVFLGGINEFRGHKTWPPAGTTPFVLSLGANGALGAQGAPRAVGAATASEGGYDEYISDPNRPVPFVGYVVRGMTGDYMTEDQRFASYRPDVLVYRTEPLEEDLVIAGPVDVKLTVSSSGTDSDFVVKLIDVYPGDYPQPAAPGAGAAPAAALPVNYVRMGGYQQLVRGEPFRAKFRGGFDAPKPMTPNQPETLSFALPDVYHAFRRGHRVMVQVQSSWFPLVDRNPQTFIDIPRATTADFRKATQRVFRGPQSTITVHVEPARK